MISEAREAGQWRTVLEHEVMVISIVLYTVEVTSEADAEMVAELFPEPPMMVEPAAETEIDVDGELVAVMEG
jgi:hypothetical protein